MIGATGDCSDYAGLLQGRLKAAPTTTADTTAPTAANYAGLLQIPNLFANGEGELVARNGARLVITDERPIQDGDRAGEHAFHGFLG